MILTRGSPRCLLLMALIHLLPWGGSDGIESACSAEDLGSVPGLGKYPGEKNCCPLPYSWLENSMDREAWWATVHGVTKSWTGLSNWHTNTQGQHEMFVGWWLSCIWYLGYLPDYITWLTCEAIQRKEGKGRRQGEERTDGKKGQKMKLTGGYIC